MPSVAVGDHVIPLYTPKFRFDVVAAIEDGWCTPKTLVDQDDADQFLSAVSSLLLLQQSYEKSD